MTRAERLLKAFQTTHPIEYAQEEDSGDAGLDGLFDLEKVLAEYYKSDYGPRPSEASVGNILSALTDPLSLIGAFEWDGTPQGDKFWRDQYIARELTEEGRAVLTAWLEAE